MSLKYFSKFGAGCCCWSQKNPCFSFSAAFASVLFRKAALCQTISKQGKTLQLLLWICWFLWRWKIQWVGLHSRFYWKYFNVNIVFCHKMHRVSRGRETLVFLFFVSLIPVVRITGSCSNAQKHKSAESWFRTQKFLIIKHKRSMILHRAVARWWALVMLKRN